jgi:hypothetical protein
MATSVPTYSGVNYENPPIGTKTFPLVTSGGLDIDYLLPSHIHVYKSVVGDSSETELMRPSGWDFDSTGKVVVLTSGIQNANRLIRIQRITPSAHAFTVFQKGTLLTADQLNASAIFTLCVVQEYYDTVSSGSGGEDAVLALQRATEALARSNDAMIAAGDAITAAYDAEAAANTAAGTANSALTSSSTATNTANTAKTTADSALSQISTVDTKATNALTKADAALSAVSSASIFVPVDNVAAIPASPTANSRVEIRNSTGIENVSPRITGLPSGFVGNSALYVRIDWSGTEWRYNAYGANDPEARYVAAPLPTASASQAGIVQLSNTTSDTSTVKAATAAALKSAYDLAQTAIADAQAAAAAVSAKASLASPSFTGVPTAPTAPVNTSTTQLATTAFVNNEIANDAPGKTGAGASGTWPISISGNADTANTATALATSRTISLTGDVSGSASFNGTANASITTAVANDSHTHTSATVTDLAAGTYTPTVSALSNLGAATIGSGDFMYQRVGNIVTVSGKMTLTATAANSICTCAITVPVARTSGNFTNTLGAAGSGSDDLGTGQIRIQSASGGQLVTIRSSCTATTAKEYGLTFSYIL